MARRLRPTSVVIPNRLFAEGSALPRVCVLTGQPAGRMFARRAATRLSLLHRFSIFLAGPAFMLVASTRDGLNGWLPVSEAAEKRLTRLRRIRLGAIIAFFGSLVTYSLWYPLGSTVDSVLGAGFVASFASLTYLTLPYT